MRRKELFEAQDELDAQRDALISDVEAWLPQGKLVNEIFGIRWPLQ